MVEKIKVEIGEKVFEAKASWEHCEIADLKQLMPISLLKPEQLPALVWVELVRIVLGASEAYMHRLKLSMDQFQELKDLCKWVFETKFQSFKNNEFIHNKKKYILPADGFENTTALELSLGAMYFTNLVTQSQSPESPPSPGGGVEDVSPLTDTSDRPGWGTTEEQFDLEKLCAVFCRTGKGGVREKYEEGKWQERVEEFKSLEFGVKLAFLHWFQVNFIDFIESYEEVFGGKKEEEKRYPDGRGWVFLLKNLAKVQYLGDLEKVHGMNAHDAWSYLLDDVLDSKAIKKDAD